MSCYYKALHRLIPEVLLTAGFGSEVVIVSPWIWNVELSPPRFGEAAKLYTHSKIRLRELLSRMTSDLNYRITIVVRPGDESTKAALTPLIRAPINPVQVFEFNHIHAKMIVTQKYAIEMTANLITTSLHRNIESCSIVKNRFHDAREYVSDKLGINI